MKKWSNSFYTKIANKHYNFVIKCRCCDEYRLTTEDQDALISLAQNIDRSQIHTAIDNYYKWVKAKWPECTLTEIDAQTCKDIIDGKIIPYWHVDTMVLEDLLAIIIEDFIPAYAGKEKESGRK